MKVRTRLEDANCVITLYDADSQRTDLGDTDLAAVMGELTSAATEGRAFWLECETPIAPRVEIYVDEAPRAELQQLLPDKSGSYRLDLPSGLLQFGTVEDWRGARQDQATEIELPSGSYAVTLRDGQVMDTRELTRRLKDLIGEADWRYHDRVGALGFLGCLPMVGMFVAAMLQKWRILGFYVLPAFAVIMGLWALLRRSSRYRRVEEARASYERELPHMVFELTPTTDAASLSGGGIRI
jgi:hypothetical protein